MGEGGGRKDVKNAGAANIYFKRETSPHSNKESRDHAIRHLKDVLFIYKILRRYIILHTKIIIKVFSNKIIINEFSNDTSINMYVFFKEKRINR